MLNLKADIQSMEELKKKKNRKCCPNSIHFSLISNLHVSMTTWYPRWLHKYSHAYCTRKLPQIGDNWCVSVCHVSRNGTLITTTTAEVSLNGRISESLPLVEKTALQRDETIKLPNSDVLLLTDKVTLSVHNTQGSSSRVLEESGKPFCRFHLCNSVLDLSIAYYY